MADRLQTLVDFMLARASEGDEMFSEDVEEGHTGLYRRDIAYVRTNVEAIREGIRPRP